MQTERLQQSLIISRLRFMWENVENCLGFPEGGVNIKATTTEKLGFAGREEGIAAEAVCLIKESDAVYVVEYSISGIYT